MDFKRVEIIFIVAFFFLDIFLLISYFDRTDTNYASTPSQSLNLISEMASQKIDVPNLTEENHSAAYVQADVQVLLKENAKSLSKQTGTVNEDGSLYMSILSNPIQLSGEATLTEEDKKALDQFINSDQVLFGSEYKFFQYNAENRQVTYTQNVSGLPVADGTSSIILYIDRSNQVISYEQKYAGPMTEQGSKVELITDRSAIETLFRNNDIPANSKISRPILTYYRSLKLEDLSMYAPVWYIQIAEGSGKKVIWVDAVNGSIISGEPVEPTNPPSPPSDQDEILEEERPDPDEDDLSWEEELEEAA